MSADRRAALCMRPSNPSCWRSFKPQRPKKREGDRPRHQRRNRVPDLPKAIAAAIVGWPKWEAEARWLFSGRLLRVRLKRTKAFAPYVTYQFQSEDFKRRFERWPSGKRVFRSGLRSLLANLGPRGLASTPLDYQARVRGFPWPWLRSPAVLTSNRRSRPASL